jgi:hypothetical protein
LRHVSQRLNKIYVASNLLLLLNLGKTVRVLARETLMKPYPVLFAFALIAALSASSQGQSDTQARSENMRLVGENDLQGRSAYQPTIHHQGNRWIAYVGHHGGKAPNPLTGQVEFNGTSVVDVTDPAHPRYLYHMPGQPGVGEKGGAQMTRVCDGSSLPHADKNKIYLLRAVGQEAHEIWDVTNPSHPGLITRIGGFQDTHKSWWECDTGIAYLVAGVPAWRTKRLTRILDLSDPAHPAFVRDFGLVGQEPGSQGPLPPDLHGPISLGAAANRVYFAYGSDANGVLQIVDRDKLLHGAGEPTPENLLLPQVGRLDLSPMYGAHTSFPLPQMPISALAHDKADSVRDFVMVVGEEMKDECVNPRQMVLFVDVTDEKHPVVVSNYTVPDPDGHFCTEGGRFGSHASNENGVSFLQEGRLH